MTFVDKINRELLTGTCFATFDDRGKVVGVPTATSVNKLLTFVCDFVEKIATETASAGTWQLGQ